MSHYRFINRYVPAAESSDKIDVQKALELNRVRYKDELLSKSDFLKKDTDYSMITRHRRRVASGKTESLPPYYLISLRECDGLYTSAREEDLGGYRRYKFLLADVDGSFDGEQIAGGYNYLHGARTRGSATDEDIAFLLSAKVVDLRLRIGWSLTFNTWSKHPKVLSFILADGTEYKLHGEQENLGESMGESYAEANWTPTEQRSAWHYERFAKELDDGSYEMDWDAYDERYAMDKYENDGFYSDFWEADGDEDEVYLREWGIIQDEY